MKRIVITLTLFLLSGSAWSMAMLKDNGAASSMFVGAYHQTADNQTRITIGTSIPMADHLYALTYGDIGGAGGSANAELVFYFKPISEWNLYIGILSGPNIYYDDPTFDFTAATGIILVQDVTENLGAWSAWKSVIGDEPGLNKWRHIIGGGVYFYLK